MAGYVAKETIEAVHNQTDIISVVGEFTKLERRSGNDWWGCCPFHHEKTASFHVDGDKRFFYCFSCHESGDVISFVMKTQNLSYGEAIHQLAKKSGIEVKYQDGYKPQEQVYDKTKDEMIELYERTSSMFHYLLMESPQGKDCLEYITKRGLTKETLEKFRLGYSPADRNWLKKFLLGKNFSNEFLSKSGLFSKNYPDIAFFSDRLMFPIFNRNGQCVAMGGRILHPKSEKDPKYLNSGDLIQYKKGETLYAFNFAKDAIRRNKKVIFCEGYMDCIAYHQAGIEYAVAPLGTALTEEQIKIVRGFADTILLSFDADGAGQNATMRAILMCRKMDLEVRVIRLKGGKDPAEILLNFGKENLTTQVNNSILDCDYLLNRLGDLYPIETPEGKARAAQFFFPYVDALQSDIQKESSLELLGQTLNLRPEAVTRDFQNRNQTRERETSGNRPTNNQQDVNPKIQLNAETRGLLAVAANPEYFKVLRENFTENDFRDPSARYIYRILEECFSENSLTLPLILDRCQNTQLVQLITDTVSSGVYNRDNAQTVIQDFMKFMKRTSLENRITGIQGQIKKFIPVTPEDFETLNKLLSEKMMLEQQAKNLR